MRPVRAWAPVTLFLTTALIGCGSTPTDDAAWTGADCPADDPECDRLEQPCVLDEEEDPVTLGPSSSPMGLAESKTTAGKYRVWPKGRIPYKIAAAVGNTTKTRLLAAMNEWQTKSEERVRFEKATSDDHAYVLITEGSPRVDGVGYKADTKRTLYLRNPEYQTVIRHELGHVLGFHHEHRRSDRADFIIVKSANIVDTADCKYQFSLCTDCTLVKSYNVGSVMHYRSTRDLAGCRVDGKPVLLDPNGNLIDHDWLITKGDLAGVAELYPSPPSTVSDAGAVSDAASAKDTGSVPDAELGGTSGWGETGGTGAIVSASGGASSENLAVSDADSGCQASQRTPSDTPSWILLLAAAALIRKRTRR